MLEEDIFNVILGWVRFKLRPLVVSNRILDDLDFKPLEFDCRLGYKSNFKMVIESMIAILNKKRSLFDWSRSILIKKFKKTTWMSIKRSKTSFKRSKKSIYIEKESNLIEKVNLFDILLISFDQIWTFWLNL